ncbi:hypothetical protein DRO56_01310 [Candidatus Bathyarchaeota archaeon]|nr:MAG: hypothetical protein DRO56_01310 [Candidatus Bathyarchaeota archaeon]
MKEEVSEITWSKLLELRPEWLWLITLILIIAPMIFPIHAPFRINESTLRVYEFVENLPEGSVVVSGGAGNYAFMYETSAAFIAFLNQIKNRDIKLIIFPLHPDSLMFEPWAIRVAGFDKVKEYGKDWVILNYIPGGSYITLPAFMQDIKGLCRTDLYGTPLDELPIFNNVDNYEDIDLWVDCGANSMWSLVRYVAPYHVPIIGFVHSAYYPMFQPFKAAGLVYEFTNGIRGGAEYEKLVGYTPWNLGTITMDAYNLYSIYVLILVILANIGTQILKKGGCV